MTKTARVVSPSFLLLSMLGLLLGMFLLLVAFSRQPYEGFEDAATENLEQRRARVVHRIQPGFLSAADCDAIRQIATQQGFMTSRVVSNGKAAGALDTSVRVSEQAWIKPENHPVVMKLYRQVEKMTGVPITRFEDMQVVRYQEGGHYKEHYDCCRDDEQCDDFWRLGGRRVHTVLVYLNGRDEVQEGGETAFPRLGLEVAPEKGKMIWFQSIRADGTLNTDSLHAGKPVTKGSEKVACQIWIRQRDRPERQGLAPGLSS
jgi:prolyl 4-hydroxylase